MESSRISRIRENLTGYFITGDGIIDEDEFEYVLSLYNIPAKDCRAAYLIFTEVSVDLNIITFKHTTIQAF